MQLWCFLSCLPNQNKLINNGRDSVLFERPWYSCDVSVVVFYYFISVSATFTFDFRSTVMGINNFVGRLGYICSPFAVYAVMGYSIKRAFKIRKPLWPLWGEFTGDRWIPRINGQWRGKCFHLMTSSCYEKIGCQWWNFRWLSAQGCTFQWLIPSALVQNKEISIIW